MKCCMMLHVDSWEFQSLWSLACLYQWILVLDLELTFHCLTLRTEQVVKPNCMHWLSSPTLRVFEKWWKVCTFKAKKSAFFLSKKAFGCTFQGCSVDLRGTDAARAGADGRDLLAWQGAGLENGEGEKVKITIGMRTSYVILCICKSSPFLLVDFRCF